MSSLMSTAWLFIALSSAAAFALPVDIQLEVPQKHNEERVDNSVVEMNGKIWPNLFEGDIFLTEGQQAMLEELRGNGDKDASRSKRLVPMLHFDGKAVQRWETDRPIPYRFQPNLRYMVKKVERAIAILSKESCLSFEHNTSATYGLDFNNGVWCGSVIGKVGGWQEVSLRTPGCEFIGVAVHEILHALGSHHEQTRSDRNNYIEVHMDRIKSGFHSDYQINELFQNDLMDLPYDYGSIMHYGPSTFAIDENKPVIVAKDPLYAGSMGQRIYPSFNDLKGLNKMYQCGKSCPSPLSCENGGYVHPHDCNKCVCPSFFEGARCEIIINDIIFRNNTLDKTLKHSSKADSVEDHRDPDWSEYAKSDPLIVSAAPGKRLNVTINMPDIPIGYTVFCDMGCKGYGLELVEGDDLTRGGKILCCPKALPISFISKTNRLGVKSYNALKTAFSYEILIVPVE